MTDDKGSFGPSVGYDVTSHGEGRKRHLTTRRRSLRVAFGCRPQFVEEISGSHSGNYELQRLQGSDTVYSGRSLNCISTV